jgi:hypothetical protein
MCLYSNFDANSFKQIEIILFFKNENHINFEKLFCYNKFNMTPSSTKTILTLLTL